jgi:hypothetical protein
VKKQPKKPKSPLVDIPLDQITGGLAPSEQARKLPNEEKQK